MNRLRVCIVGDSLFAESIAYTLRGWEMVELVSRPATIEEALPWLETSDLDAVVVAGTDQGSTTHFGPLLAEYPNLMIIRADLSTDKIQIITSRCVHAREADLLATMVKRWS